MGRVRPWQRARLEGDLAVIEEKRHTEECLEAAAGVRARTVLGDTSRGAHCGRCGECEDMIIILTPHRLSSRGLSLQSKF